MAIEADAPRSRRSVIAAALGGAGALIAASLGRAAPVAAADNDPLLLGSTANAATLPTVVASSQGPGLEVGTTAGGGSALVGHSATGIGVFGVSDGPGFGRETGVVGVTGGGDSLDPTVDTSQTGVYGFADDSNAAAGVWGDTLEGTGVVGTGAWGVYGSGEIGIVGDTDGASTGVYGFAGDQAIVIPPPSTGVAGIAGLNGAVGVRGHATSGTAIGVWASSVSVTQTALQVNGKVKLSRSGRASVGSTSTSKKVTMVGVTTSSYVVATMQTNVSGLYVRAVVPTTGSFTIYLSKAPGKTVYVGYVVVN
jgi:hypothetical protein